MKYELKRRNKPGWVEWDGATGEDAARRYVGEHRSEVIVAIRRGERHGIFEGIGNIIEPGDPRYHDRECPRCGRMVKPYEAHREYPGYHASCAESALAERGKR